MMPKENRRTRITKMLLNDSFLRLLEKKPLARVTVKDICEDADLNRSTYYQYYKDPYDQMGKLEVDIIEELYSCIGDSKDITADNLSGLHVIVKQVLDYMQAHKNMFRILLSNNGDISLQKDILTVFSEKLLPQDFKVSKESRKSSTLLQKFIFIGNGSFGLIYYWLMTDNNESTEELARRIASFIEKFMKST